MPVPDGLILRRVAESLRVPAPWLTTLFTEVEIEQEIRWMDLQAKLQQT